MSTEPFIGEVKLFGFYFNPRGYMTCQGQMMSIAQNTALFSLLGTNYGGDGQVTFGLPDLQGRIPIGQGQGQGLPSYEIGEKGGFPNVTITTNNMPPHAHPGQGITVTMPVSTGGADASSPAGAYLCDGGTDAYSSVPTAGQNYAPLAIGGTTGVTGSGLPISVMNPYLVMNYSIATEGIFPSRP